jgi:hypothetical protein
MAVDREERLRQQQELEEIRRSFAEMGARMGSLFEPAEPDDDEEEPAGSPARPTASLERAAPLAPPRTQGQPAALPAPVNEGPPASEAPRRSRWRLVAALALALALGIGLGYALPGRQTGGAGPSADSAAPAGSAPPAPSVGAAPTRPVAAPVPPTPPPRVPQACREAIRAANQVIFYQNRNMRDRRLAEELARYSRASQACNKEASP